MITFPCSHCGAGLRVPPKRAGSTGRCPRCDRPITVPLRSDSSTVVAVRRVEAAPNSADKPRSGEMRGADELAFLSPPLSGDELGRLGSYRILAVLGTGGMGVVFRAEDIKLRRPVALKVMKKAVAAVAMHRERFLREAQATAAIEHDHIVPIYQVDEDRGVPFLAMKLLVGESLEDRLQRQGMLPPGEICRIGMEIAEGLAAAHERGLIHRDIKPANIWLEEGRDRVRIVDFGLVQSSEDDVRLTAENFLVGTPAYMSPEQASGDVPLDHRTDLFSLGVVLYRMATGNLPFKGKSAMNVLTALATRQAVPPREVNPEVPRALSEVILSLLQKDPDLRPRNARMVIAALADAATTPDVEPPDDEEETEVAAPPAVSPLGPDPVSVRLRRPPPRRRPAPRRERETDEERLARKAIRFAIFGGLFVFVLLTFLVVRNLFFRKTDPDPGPPAPPPPPARQGD